MVFRPNKFKHPQENILQGLRNAFDYVIYEIVNNSVEGSKISIYISLPNSPHEKPIWSRLRPVSEINAELILSLISSINQSISPIPVENYFSYPYGSKRIKFQV